MLYPTVPALGSSTVLLPHGLIHTLSLFGVLKRLTTRVRVHIVTACVFACLKILFFFFKSVSLFPFSQCAQILDCLQVASSTQLCFCFLPLPSFPPSLALSLFLTAPEEEAYRERYSDHHLPGAGRSTVHAPEHSLSLPACLCDRSCSQPLFREHLLQVQISLLVQYCCQLP